MKQNNNIPDPWLLLGRTGPDRGDAITNLGSIADW